MEAYGGCRHPWHGGKRLIPGSHSSADCPTPAAQECAGRSNAKYGLGGNVVLMWVEEILHQLVVYPMHPMIYWGSSIQGGAGFLPSVAGGTRLQTSFDPMAPWHLFPLQCFFFLRWDPGVQDITRQVDHFQICALRHPPTFKPAKWKSLSFERKNMEQHL